MQCLFLSVIALAVQGSEQNFVINKSIVQQLPAEICMSLPPEELQDFKELDKKLEELRTKKFRLEQRKMLHSRQTEVFWDNVTNYALSFFVTKPKIADKND